MAKDTAHTAHRACTPVNRSQLTKNTAHTTQHTEQAHRRARAKWPRTPQSQHNTPSGHTGVQEPSGQGHHTGNTSHRAGTPVNRSEVAKDTAHTAE